MIDSKPSMPGKTKSYEVWGHFWYMYNVAWPTDPNADDSHKAFSGKTWQIFHFSHTAAKKECKWSESHSIMSDSVTPWTIQSMEFSRPEYWSE